MKEPLDDGCDKTVAQQGLLDRIKEEPDDAQEYGPQESELKISAVFSASDTSLGFQPSFPSLPAACLFCCGCKKLLHKGQPIYHKAGSAQLFCSTGCISRHSSAVSVPPLPKRTCKHCSRDILNPMNGITTQLENSSLCKDFCSQSCLFSYELTKPVVTVYTRSISVKCTMCQKNIDNLAQKPLYALGTSPMLSAEIIKTTNDPGKAELFCSINCLSAYRIKTVISSGLQVLCQSCKIAAVPQYHLAMSNGTICSFCSSNCVLAFQNIFKKPKGRKPSLAPVFQNQEVPSTASQSEASAGQGAPASSVSSSVSSPAAAALETLANQSQEIALVHSFMKLKCQQCNLLFATKPELLFYKGRMFLFCCKACSDEYKMRNKVKALCDYCKLQKIIKDTVRFSGVDKPFCSEVCKFLSTRDFGERWGNYCKMCSYCLQTSANLVENRLDGKLQVFCCEDCMSKFTALFHQTARCDGCKRQGKLSESLKWRGNIKYFCNLFCVLKFCHQYSMNDPIPQKKVFVLPKPTSAVTPKAQTTLTTPLSPKIATTPVITSVISLAKIPALQPTDGVLTGSDPKEAAETIGNGSAPAAADTLQSSQSPKLLKNKGILCKPVTQTKATACRPYTYHAACQTDLLLPNGKNEEPDSPPAKKKRTGFSQSYDTEYIKFGFIIHSGSKESSPRPQCVICGEILPSESVMPISLCNHLKTKHSELENKPVDFFEEKSLEMECQNSSLRKCLLVEESLVKASYLIAFQIAARKKPFSIAEELIKPYLVEMCSEVLGSSAGDKMKAIPLSSSTVGCRINKLSADIEEQLVQKLRESKWFALQIDESPETSDVTRVLCFVRFIDYDYGDVKEELLFCTEMPSPSTDLEVFELINKYFDSRSLNWNHCVGFCTDGAGSMTDRCSRLRSKIQEITKNTVTFTHCFIHREYLAAEKLSPCLYAVLLQSAKILSFVKSSASDPRMLRALCEEVGSEDAGLPLNAEVRWLSRGRILTRLFDLRHEIEIFLNQKQSDLARCFHDKEWVAKLAYLADILSLINKLNSSLQGTVTTFFNLYNKVDIFKKKLKSWLKHTQEGDYDMFPLFSEFLDSSDVSGRNVASIIVEHLEGLSQMFHDCYPPEKDLRSGNLWLTDPFASCQNRSLTDSEEEQLAALSSDMRLVSAYKSMSVTQFWVNTKTSYPELHEKAMKLLLPFSTICLCDATFAALSALKQRNLLICGPALRLAVTSLVPRIEKLVKEKE